MKKTKQLMVHTAVLTGASLIMRLVSMAFGVYIAGRIGAESIGLFELIMSVYMLGISLAASGVKLSATRLVVEAQSRPDYTPRRAMRLCMAYGASLGIMAACALFLCAPFIANDILQRSEVTLPLRILACGLPFIALSHALSGYFTAVRKTGRFAAVQVLEQFMRIGITLFLLDSLLILGERFAALALVTGACLAEALSLSLSFALYRSERMGKLGAPCPGLLFRLLRISLPDAVGSWVRSFLHTAKHLLIPRGLRLSGASAEGALASYGVLSGMALPIITFPSAFLTALSGLLIPELAECRSLGQQARIKYMTDRVINITIGCSTVIAALMLLLADLLGGLLYPGTDAALFIRVLAPIVPIMYTDMAIDGILKGLGLQVASMKYNIIDASISLALVLTVLPILGIWGYVLTIYVSELLNFGLSINKLRRVTDFSLRPMGAEDLSWMFSIFKRG